YVITYDPCMFLVWTGQSLSGPATSLTFKYLRLDHLYIRVVITRSQTPVPEQSCKYKIRIFVAASHYCNTGSLRINRFDHIGAAGPMQAAPRIHLSRLLIGCPCPRNIRTV